MDSRKPHSSDHFFSVHTFNRWMASGFGLGVMASLMVISGIVYVSTPIPSTISTSFSSVFESVPGGVSHSKPEKSAGFLPGNEGGVIAEKAHDRNPPASSLTGREPVLEKTHEGNLVGDDKDSSSLLNREKTHDGNSSGISSTGLESDAVKRNSTVDFKDSSDLVSSGILKETHDGNLSKSSINERMQGNWTGESSDSSSMVTVKDSSHKTLDGDLPKSSFSGNDRYVGNSTGDTETSSVKTPVEDASGGIPKMTVPSEKINEANSSWSNVTNPNGGNTSKDYNVGEGFGKKDGIDEKEHGRNGEGRNVSHGSDEGWSSERMHEGASKINGSDSTKMREDFSETCNIFNGRWVRDERQPFYAPGSCPYIDDDFNCHKNGRTDDGFLRWRWQPNDCNIPRLNATDFLERLRSKRLIFVGDSLNRNMWESLVCILRDSVSDKSRVYEVAGRSEFKTSGYYAFRFEDYNCSVDFVRSSFLVKEIFSKNANGSEDEKLRLDLLDETTSAYREAEIIVFNTGHWWTHDKTSRGIDYYQEGNYVYPVLKANEAYKKALSTWARWVDKNINSNKSQVVFRGYSLTHFRGGQWNSGGQCHTETEPIFNESFLAKYPLKMRTLERVMDQMRTPVIYLNISRLTDYRKDGHPSIYRKTYKTVAEQIAAEKSQDCSHWCLPGIPDTWNELLYASLLMGGQGSWRRSNNNSDTSSSR